MHIFRRLLLTAVLVGPVWAADPVQRDDGFIATTFLGEGKPKAQVLLLGMFHFQDAGLDGFKPQHAFEINSAERQAELADLLRRLAAFKPTRIAIEGKAPWQATADERYAGFLAGTFPLTDQPNEIYQVGFRLGQMAGLKRVDCIDVMGRHFPDELETMDQARAYAKTRGEEAVLEDGWIDRFKELYAYDDALKTRIPLRNYLLYLNSPERLRKGHGHYLTGYFKIGAGDKFYGADELAASWYGRNLRIFTNLLHLVRSPEERMVVIFGAGHLPILRHLVESSPDLRLVEVREVLGAP